MHLLNLIPSGPRQKAQTSASPCSKQQATVKRHQTSGKATWHHAVRLGRSFITMAARWYPLWPSGHLRSKRDITDSPPDHTTIVPNLPTTQRGSLLLIPDPMGVTLKSLNPKNLLLNGNGGVNSVLGLQESWSRQVRSGYSVLRVLSLQSSAREADDRHET